MWLIRAGRNNQTEHGDMLAAAARPFPMRLYAASLAGAKRAASQPSMTRLRAGPHS